MWVFLFSWMFVYKLMPYYEFLEMNLLEELHLFAFLLSFASSCLFQNRDSHSSLSTYCKSQSPGEYLCSKWYCCHLLVEGNITISLLIKNTAQFTSQITFVFPESKYLIRVFISLALCIHQIIHPRVFFSLSHSNTKQVAARTLEFPIS